MHKIIAPPERKSDTNTVSFRGLSGLQIEVDTSHHDAGRQATIATGAQVEVLGFATRNLYNTLAVRLPNGKVTAVAPEELQYEKN